MTTEAPLLPCVEIEPTGPARSAVIWLHGLGADGHDFEPIVPHLGIPESTAVRFVFPHAPTMPVTLNYGVFVNTIIDFIIIAASIFVAVKVVNALQRKEEAKPAPPPAPSNEERLLAEIRDLLKPRQ